MSIWQLSDWLWSYIQVDRESTAYVMEYLDWSEWETLDIFMNTSPIVLSSTELQKVPEVIVSALKSKNYIHSDL